jgi:hypothetical protein
MNDLDIEDFYAHNQLSEQENDFSPDEENAQHI